MIRAMATREIRMSTSARAEEAFPRLTPAQMERLASRGRLREVHGGEVLWEAGAESIPFIVVTVYAGLAQVPDELVEAAEIDGARPWRIFFDVTFPLLRPIFLILTSLSIIWDFGVFAQPYLLIRPEHQFASNYLMGTYVFIKGYAEHDFGRGARTVNGAPERDHVGEVGAVAHTDSVGARRHDRAEISPRRMQDDDVATRRADREPADHKVSRRCHAPGACRPPLRPRR